MKPFAFATCALTVFAAAFAIISISAAARAEFPKPSPFPISWELKFEHSKPERIVVKVPTEAAAQA